MIKKYLKSMIITSIVALLPIACGLILWNKLPSALPIHWNAAGEIDGYASKAVVVFVMPLVLLALHWLCVFVTASDPKRQKDFTEKSMLLVLWITPAISIIVSLMTYLTALGSGLRVEMILPASLGFLLAVIGNYLPKCKQSYTVGIKLPWTLHSEENWNRTHRLAGYVWMACGLGMMILGFLGLLLVSLVFPLVAALVPSVYSYILYRKGI